MGYLSEIEVVDNDDIKSGYEIKFTFDKNPFFSNSVLSKCFFVTEDGEVNNSSPTIEWHTVGAIGLTPPPRVQRVAHLGQKHSRR